VGSDEEIGKVIEHIKAKGMKVGLAIKPKTPSSVLYPFIDKIDMALVMVPKSLSPNTLPL
jgi:ribulose-phosphate 3-epimerase